MRLEDLFDGDLLAEMTAGRYVRTESHPTLPLTILNYTEKAQYERVWNAVTRTCRGLIFDHGTGEVVARPFPKFFNHDEPGVAFDPGEKCVVTDKADGSLGIVYGTPDGVAVATRGSFVSNQARHATAVLRARYPDWRPPSGGTALFEIIYPENRIVVDYGAFDDLVLLGVVDIDTGDSTSGQNSVGWAGPIVESFGYRTFAEALAAPARPGREGLVVHFASGLRVKIKQNDYVTLHRLLTGFTARRLWQRAAVHAIAAADANVPAKRIAQALKLDPADVDGIMADPDWRATIRRIAPEEFTDWIDTTIADLARQVRELIVSVEHDLAGLRDLPRAEVAARVKDHPHKSMVFAALDGRSLVPQAWAHVRPEHEQPYFARPEEAE
ncbi:RNA ligase [Herbihabitans rhizosphaerae]|uniref:RNA ligase n=1 Tax=Herbihabitans rhizosphaerae TaxID=1872711 RepID=A0A4Q7KC98_9PSEU|nr:RNA ligase [Herbihabitans rhizosphaerae]RZS29834.1 RNA ligase [Herbihabitans rhizosphaerae]